MGSSNNWLKIIACRKDLELISINEKPDKWNLWKTFNFIRSKVNNAGRDAAKKKRLRAIGKNVAFTEERAAICIQTAFRVFLARKVLRALKGLVRLQAAITGHDTPKQSSTSLHCIHAFIRVQARIHRQQTGINRDALEPGQKEVTTLVLEKHTPDPEIDWCNTLGTVEEIQEKEYRRRVAAIKRDRAIAYAFSNKWKDKTKIYPGSLFDCNFDDSSWIWVWLDDWLNGQSKEISILHGAIKQQNKGVENLPIQKNSATVEIHNHKCLRASAGRTKDCKVVHTRVRSPGGPRFAKSLPGGKERRPLPLSPKQILQSKKSSGKLKRKTSSNRKWKTSLHNT